MWIAFAAHTNTPYATLAIALAVCGADISIACPALHKAILSSVERKCISNTSGVFNISRQLGGALGIITSVTVLQVRCHTVKLRIQSDIHRSRDRLRADLSRPSSVTLGIRAAKK